MAWQDEMIPMLRILINDFSSEPTYSDERLTDLIITSAYLVNNEANITTDYNISMSLKTISPDPINIDDDLFVSLVMLKAACLADQSTFRTKALLEGVKAAMGPASLTVAGHLAGFKTLLELGPCKAFEDLKLQAAFSMGLNVRAILSPFVGNKFDPSILRTSDSRDRNDWA